MSITDPKQMCVSESIKQRLNNIGILVYFSWISQIHPSFCCIWKFCYMIINVVLSWLSFSFWFLTLRSYFLNGSYVRLLWLIFPFNWKLCQLSLNLTSNSLMWLSYSRHLLQLWTLSNSNVLHILLNCAHIVWWCHWNQSNRISRYF